MSLISYSSFKNNINKFNSEEYLKNQIDTSSFDLFLDFIQKYREIENEDLKKPIFSQTTKFKKNPNNYKHYKSLKMLRDKDEHKNVWSFQAPTEEITKITILIKSYLNKISEDTYKDVSVEFINELLNIKNNNIFSILSQEIFNKCIFEQKFRNLYINLCSKIWSNKDIHYNLTEITIDNNVTSNNYYWNLIGNPTKYGPFINENATKNNIYSTLHFKKYFVNYIQKLYFEKDLSFNNLNEEECFAKKKKILLLVEIISIMYIDKYISFDIINIIIIDLLHINKFDNIEDIEYECLYNMLKIIKENKTNYSCFNDNKVIFDEFIKYINHIITNADLSKRSLFFMNEVCSFLNLFIDNKKHNNNLNNIDNATTKTVIINKLDTLVGTDIDKIVSLYKNISNKTDKQEILYKIIDKYISMKKTNDNLLLLIKNFKDNDTYYDILDKFVTNVKDIMLDVPNANIRLIHIINNLPLDKVKNNKYMNVLKNTLLDGSDSECTDDE